MKITHINFSDYSGGASRAAFRIASSQNRLGNLVKFIVCHKETDSKWVIKSQPNKFELIRRIMEKLFSYFYPKKSRSLVSLNWFSNPSILKEIKKFSPDIVNLHWICHGALGVKDLRKIDAPIVWTLHDMWPFMGVQHYVINKSGMGCCGALLFNFLEKVTTKYKKRNWEDLNLTIVCPSNWIANQAIRSELFIGRKIHVIPNTIDVDIFKPIAQDQVRRKYGLSKGKKFILFGAANATLDDRKGYAELLKALSLIPAQLKESVELLVFGSDRPGVNVIEGLNSHFFGNVSGEHELVEIYNCADVMIVPSLQENLANTIVESLACAVPVVAFNNGGSPDAIDHMQTGYLAEPFSPTSLAQGVVWTLKNSDILDLKNKSRKKATEYFSLEVVTRKYLELYESLNFFRN